MLQKRKKMGQSSDKVTIFPEKIELSLGDSRVND